MGLAGHDARRPGDARAHRRGALGRGVARVGGTACGRRGPTRSGCRTSTASIVRYLGPAHGFAGNALALAGGGLLDAARREELDRRVAAVANCVRRARRRARPVAARRRPRPAGAGHPHAVVPRRARHGRLARGHRARRREFTELLVAGGELTWRAGPLAKGAGPLSRDRRQRLRAAQALRAHGRRGLARPRPAPSRCTRPSRPSASARLTAWAATGCGRATSASRCTSRAASRRPRRCRRSTGSDHGIGATERRWNRTNPPPGCDGSPVLKTGWGTSPGPLRAEG